MITTILIGFLAGGELFLLICLIVFRNVQLDHHESIKELLERRDI